MRMLRDGFALPRPTFLMLKLPAGRDIDFQPGGQFVLVVAPQELAGLVSGFVLGFELVFVFVFAFVLVMKAIAEVGFDKRLAVRLG